VYIFNKNLIITADSFLLINLRNNLQYCTSGMHEMGVVMGIPFSWESHVYGNSWEWE